MYKVLLADDEPLILAGLRRKIDWNALGFEIAGECADGKSLQDKIVALVPDLLILDIQMPHMTGLEVLHSIHHIAPVPSIVISGFSDFAYAQDALRCGVIDYLLKPVSSAMLQEAVLKAKQRLDLITAHGRKNAGLMFQFLRMNIESMSDTVILSLLSLSGTKKYYWIAAFYGGGVLERQAHEEIAMLRYDEKTVIAVNHSDALPGDYEAFLKSRFSYNGGAGVCKPFAQIRQIPQAADEAVAALETSWFKRGVYLWPTENESRSVRFFLDQMEKAGRDSAEISGMLSALPDYLQKHRLNVRSVEAIYNALMLSPGGLGQGQPAKYLAWKEIRARYQNADYFLSDLLRVLAPGAEGDTSASSSRAVVLKIKGILQKDYAKPLSLQSMAARFHIDNSYLSSLFRENTGKTFTNYLTEIRVQHALEYLKTTALPNGKIAQLCGFTSDSYMKKVFRKVLGVTPSVYRTQAVEKIPGRKQETAKKKEEQT